MKQQQERQNARAILLLSIPSAGRQPMKHSCMDILPTSKSTFNTLCGSSANEASKANTRCDVRSGLLSIPSAGRQPMKQHKKVCDGLLRVRLSIPSAGRQPMKLCSHCLCIRSCMIPFNTLCGSSANKADIVRQVVITLKAFQYPLRVVSQ